MLLDESLPHDLAPLLTGHEVVTVQRHGWAGTKNGTLLALAAANFDAFVTADRNIPHQQNVASFDLRIIVVAAFRNRIEDLRPLIPRILASIETSEPGVVTWIRA